MQKDVKILSFAYDNNQEIKLHPDGRYSIVRNDNEELLLKGNHALEAILTSQYGSKILKISVDGIVYKIGDKIRHKNNPEDVYHPIVSFNMKQSMDYNGSRESQYVYAVTKQYSHNGLNVVNMLKEEDEDLIDIVFEQEKICFEALPIIISEDGANLYEGDDCYIVNTSFGIKKIDVDKSISGLVFSEKVNAEKYVISNKPIFSLEDLIDLELVGVDEQAKYIDIINKRLNGTN